MNVSDYRVPIKLGDNPHAFCEAYGNYHLPDLLLEPLMYNPNGKLQGFHAGIRNGLIKADGKLFKLKGILNVKDRVKRFEGSKYVQVLMRDFINDEVDSQKEPAWKNQPWGRMTEDRCRDEFQFAAEYAEKYRSHGLVAPLEPAAIWIEKDQTFKGKRVCSSVMEIPSDLRVDNFNRGLYWYVRRTYEQTGKVEMDFAIKTLEQITPWLGFSNRVLRDLEILPIKDSTELSNYCLYPCGEGYAVGRVDLTSCRKEKFDQNFNKFVAEKMIGQNLGHLFDFLAASLLDQNGTPRNMVFTLSQFMQRIPRTGQNHFQYVSEATDRMKKEFNSYYDYKRAQPPELIDKKIVDSILPHIVKMTL